MKLTESEFDRLKGEGHLVLALIGMSNVGKTRWATKLRHAGFESIHCDDLIEARLGGRLSALGYSGIADVSRWLGQPYDERYAANQVEYLAYEEEVMRSIADSARKGFARNTAIDTTGSIAHTEEGVRRSLAEIALVVLIEATSSMADEMFRRYMQNPKPVVFGDRYRPEPGEERDVALGRAYRELLAFRAERYRELADVVIPARVAQRCKSAEAFISIIRESL